MHKIFVIGNLGQDATVETYGTDTVIRFRVANNDRFTNRMGQVQEETTWYTCSLWNFDPRAATYLLRGRLVYVEGTPRTRTYQNQNDGQYYISNDIRVTHYRLLDANPVNRDTAQAIPAGASVVQPTTSRPSEYHMEQQREQMNNAQQLQNAQQQQLPERMMPEAPAFPNAAPELPETSVANVQTPLMDPEPVAISTQDLPY